jgi:hypothetical protein
MGEPRLWQSVGLNAAWGEEISVVARFRGGGNSGKAENSQLYIFQCSKIFYAGAHYAKLNIMAIMRNSGLCEADRRNGRDLTHLDIIA